MNRKKGDKGPNTYEIPWDKPARVKGRGVRDRNPRDRI